MSIVGMMFIGGMKSCSSETSERPRKRTTRRKATPRRTVLPGEHKPKRNPQLSGDISGRGECFKLRKASLCKTTLGDNDYCDVGATLAGFMPIACSDYEIEKERYLRGDQG